MFLKRRRDDHTRNQQGVNPPVLCNITTRRDLDEYGPSGSLPFSQLRLLATLNNGALFDKGRKVGAERRRPCFGIFGILNAEDGPGEEWRLAGWNGGCQQQSVHPSRQAGSCGVR